MPGGGLTRHPPYRLFPPPALASLRRLYSVHLLVEGRVNSCLLACVAADKNIIAYVHVLLAVVLSRLDLRLGV
jgi:hypothetical protein